MNWKQLINVTETENIFNNLSEFSTIINAEIDRSGNEIGLLGGKMGGALFCFYYAKLINKQKIYDYAFNVLLKIIEDFNNGFDYHTHAVGTAGIGTAIDILTREDFIDANINKLLGGLDDYLYKLMMHELKDENFDFLHGAIGLGLYFLKRQSNTIIEKYLADFVNELDVIAHKDENGIRWLSNLNKEKNIRGYNLGLAHGGASIIVYLSKLYSAGIEKEKVSELLEGTIGYLLTQQLDISKCNSNFPSWVDIEKPSTNSRLAWCYGDLGIGIALWLAGENTDNEEWKNKATEILLHSIKRKDLKENFVVDAGLCHGTAGIAHIYNRMYNYTQRDEFKQAALYWFDQTLKMAKFEDGLAGYKVWRSIKHGGLKNEYGFLEGIAGIGLAFISAVSDIEPAWDECLLLS